MRITAVLLVIFSFVGCSPTISKLDYEKLTYEHNQLTERYQMLQQQKTSSAYLANGNVAKGVTGSTVPKQKYDDLNNSYETLQKRHAALEMAHTALKEQCETQAIEKGDKRISVKVHDRLQSDYDNLLARYETLEGKYNRLNSTTKTKKEKNKARKKKKKVKKKKKNTEEIEEKSAIVPEKKVAEVEETSRKEPITTTPEEAEEEPVIERTPPGKEQEEESSIFAFESTKKETPTPPTKQETITALTVNDLSFKIEGSQRLDDKVKIELTINNAGKRSKMKWDVKNIQFMGDNGVRYVAKDYRIGRSYASRVSGKLTKKLKSDYAVQSAFAFEDIPRDINNVNNFQVVVEINGKNTTLEFYNIEIIPTTYKDFYSDY